MAMPSCNLLKSQAIPNLWLPHENRERNHGTDSGRTLGFDIQPTSEWRSQRKRYVNPGATLSTSTILKE